MKKLVSLALALTLVFCLAIAVSAEEATPQEVYSGSVAAEGWNPGVVIPFVAPGNGVVTITVSNADPGYEVGESNTSAWCPGGASGTHDFNVEAGVEYEFQLWGHDGTSNCSATYDAVITYTGEGTVTPYVPPVPGESMDDPLPFYMPAGNVTVPAGGTVYCLYTPMMMGQDDMVLTVTGTTGFMAAGFPAMGMPATANDTAGTATVTVPYHFMKWGYVFAIANNTASEQTYSFTLAMPLGSESNPAELVMGTNTATMPGTPAGYIYAWTAEADGTLTITMPETGWTYQIQVNGEATTDSQLYSDDTTIVGEQTLTVEQYDQVIVWVNSYDPANMADMNPAVELSIEASFEHRLGSYENPISVVNPYDLTGIDAVPGETWYQISAMLAGKVLTIDADEDLKFYLNGTELTPVDGVITAEIVPAGAGGAALKVVNDTDAEIETAAGIQDPLGSEGNPYQVNGQYDMTGIDAAPGETYYVISPYLAGKVLTIDADEDLKFYLNGTELTPVDGVITAEIVPAGPRGAQLKVVNETEEEIETAAGITDPLGSEGNPILVTPMVDKVDAETAAGESTYFVVPAMLNGNYIVVEGEGLTVTVNGTAVEAKNGVYAVELTGAPSNIIVVANAGDAAASYSVSVVTDNPNTGDNTMLGVAAALLLVSACAIALVGKKKEF